MKRFEKADNLLVPGPPARRGSEEEKAGREDLWDDDEYAYEDEEHWDD